jgi:NADH-quinone oxidoreductase subunit A
MLRIKYNFFLIFLFGIFSFILTGIIFLASFFIANQNADPEKISPYECGFDPFEDARNEVDVRFYLVAILFIIFDIEAVFLYPWAISFSELDSFGFWVVVDFIVELMIGFLYAWKIGALEWE